MNMLPKEVVSNTHGRWSEVIEQESEGEVHESVDLSKLRSSLRSVDEALKFELGELGDTEFFAAIDEDELDRHESSGESEEDLHELTTK